MSEAGKTRWQVEVRRQRPEPGLYVCATPIGNLEDASLRLLRILATSDRVACEDTRHTGRLLSHFNLRTPLVSYHEQNERERTPELIAQLQQGQVVALVSDAGTPTISDPGYRLVRAAHEAGVPVWAVPGPSAVTAALSVSGLATDRFTFYGFVPRRKGERAELWDLLGLQAGTALLYESPHRLVATLEEMAQALGARPMAICRELTKQYEETIQGTPEELHTHFQATRPRGELTLVVSPAAVPAALAPQQLPLVAEVALLMESGVERMDAIRRVARAHQLPRQEVYRRVAQDDG